MDRRDMGLKDLVDSYDGLHAAIDNIEIHKQTQAVLDRMLKSCTPSDGQECLDPAMVLKMVECRTSKRTRDCEVCPFFGECPVKRRGGVNGQGSG